MPLTYSATCRGRISTSCIGPKWSESLLLNLGYACLLLKAPASSTPIAAIETLAGKLGLLLLTLGGMHFFNLYLFHRIRRRLQIRLAPPPVKPQMLHNGHTADAHV